MLEAGAELSGHVVLRPLGRGGAATVYLVRDRARGELRALKVNATGDGSSGSAEARCLGRVRHASVPPLLATVDQGLLSPFVDGPELGELLRAGALPAEAALALAAELYDVVEAVHQAGVVHRDLSPQNLLVTPSAPHLHLIDFGLALDTLAPQPREVGPRGTPGYAAPEQLADPAGVDLRADIYALGAVVFALLTGRAAFPQEDEEARIRAATASGWAEAVFSGTALPPDAERALRAALDPDPERRPATVAAFRALWEPRRGVLPPTTAAVVEALRPSERWGGLAALRQVGEEPAWWSLPAAGVTDRLPTVDHRRMGRYTLHERLGSGGMGVVWRAWDPVAEREVAVKVLRQAGRASAAQQLRFRREVRALARLEHPHVVRLLDADFADDAVWFAMELVDGPTLADRLTRDGPLPWREAARLGVELADALQHAHDRGLVHRDLKPDNVLCGPGGAALTDFGVVLDLQAQTVLTAGGQLLGTPAYMAPEQVLDPSEVRESSDIYGLGAVLFEALSGRPPREGREVEVIQALMSPAPPPPLPAHLPVEIRHVVGRAMAWEAADRYPSVGALGRDLERCMRGAPVEAAPPSIRRRLGWWAREHRLVVAALLTAVIVVALLVAGGRAVGAWTEHRRARRAEAALDAALERMAIREGRGDPEGAIAAFEAFLELPDVANTPAVARGWLYLGGRLRDDRERSLEALARAYVAADAPEVQLEVLLAQDDQRGQDPQWLKRLQVMSAILEEDVPSLLENPRARALAREAALLRRDVDRVAELDPHDPMLPLLRALQPMTTNEHAGSAWASMREWRGQRVLDLRAGAGGLSLSLEGPELRPVPHPDQDLGVSVLATPAGMDGVFLSPPGGDLRVLDFHGRTLLPLGNLHRGYTDRSVVGDLDEDGRQETWLGLRLGRTLFRIDYADGRPVRASDGHPPTSAANSDINGLAIDDFDGDGHPELALAMGPWGAYDLRLLGWRDGGLRMLGREKLGMVCAVEAVPDPTGGPPLMAVSVGPYLPSAQVFRDGEMPGIAWGLKLLRWTGETFEVAWSLSQKVGEGGVVGDFDGDGHLELAWDGVTGVVLLDHDGSGWQHATLAGITPLLAADLDHDGDDELIAKHQERLVVLGMGEERLSAEPREERRRGTLPASGPLEGPIRRAETLGELGYGLLAAERLVALADAVDARSLEAAILRRSAGLYWEAGDGSTAVDLLQQAAEMDPAMASVALAEAVEILAQGHELERAAALQARLLALGAPIADPTLAEHAAALASSVEIDLSEPLDPRWEVVAASGVRRVAGGLEVQALDRTEPLARLPLRWRGGAVVIEVEGSTTGTDWAGGIEVALRSEDGELLTALSFDRAGGGGLYHDSYACARMNTDVRLPRPPWVGRAVFRPGLHRNCQVVTAIGGRWYSVAGTPDQDLGEDLFLDVATRGIRPIELSESTWVAARLRRLRLEGVSLREARIEPDARHALADGRLDLALDRLGARGDGEAQLLRAQALDRLGHAGAGAAARQALAQAPDELPFDLLSAVRASPGLWVPELLEQRPLTAHAQLLRGWSITAQQHPDAASLNDMARRLLGHLDRVEGPLDPATLRLLLIRGGAWANQGQWELARRVLGRGRAAANELPSGRERQVLLEKILLLEARGAALAGEADATLAAVRALLVESPAPSVAAETLLADPAFDPFHDLEAWRALVEPARLRGERPRGEP